MTELEKALMHYDGDNTKPYCDLVYKALKTQQKVDAGKMVKCEYCTIDSSTRKVIGYDGSGDGISVVYGDGMAGIDSDSWEVVIHFCPMCGRKLEG